jgi:hypothetical protein
MFDALKKLLRRGKEEAEAVAAGGRTVATPDRNADEETSTNAQVEGASGEPYPGRDPDV